jgi:chorismate-pyruvate lyase
MSTPLPTPRASSSQHAAPDAQRSLLDLVGGWTAVSAGDYAIVPASEVPQPFHRLLVHHGHMTEVLEKHYGRAVELTVQQSESSQECYRRRITLAAGKDGPLVELGIVRIDFSYLPATAREAILSESIPLGRVLIEHKLLRRVVPHHYVRFDADSAVVRLYNLATPKVLYGRLGTIFCNHQPAIELLEIVTGVEPR